MNEDDMPVTHIPRPEHPRPDFMREPWLNLNGRWRFTFDPHNVGEQKRWYRLPHPQVALARGGAADPLLLAASRQGSDGVAQPFVEDPFGLEIVVPFPWESRLSGLNAKEYKGAAWYQRSIETPAAWAASPSEDGSPEWRLRPYLCFGAVDWHARVWVDGRLAGEHSGGYTPFTLDIGRFVQPGTAATVTVRAYDACDADTLLGKQTYDWYTPSSGIWQTVWLEGRPAVHLACLHITPQLEASKATFACEHPPARLTTAALSARLPIEQPARARLKAEFSTVRPPRLVRSVFMAHTHVVESTPDTVRSGLLDPTAPAVARVQSGDTVRYLHTWTHWGNEAKFGMRLQPQRPRRS